MIYRNFSNIKSLKKKLIIWQKLNIKSLKKNRKPFKKSNIKSHYRIFFGRFLALYFRNPLAGVAASSWFVETRNNKKQPTLACWVLASSGCA